MNYPKTSEKITFDIRIEVIASDTFLENGRSQESWSRFLSTYENYIGIQIERNIIGKLLSDDNSIEQVTGYSVSVNCSDFDSDRYYVDFSKRPPIK
jgi:hypothetical protein